VLPTSSRRGAQLRGGCWGGQWRKKRVRSKLTLESAAPKARSRSRAGVAMNGAMRISPRVSGKSPSLASSSFSLSVITAHGYRHTCVQRRHLRAYWPPCWYQQSKRVDDEPRDSKRRCDIRCLTLCRQVKREGEESL